MENYNSNFYFSSLEYQLRCELKDSKARLTQSTSEGRVLLEIREDSLASILQKLQEKNDGNKWSHEKEQMTSEICCLKAQLDEANATVIHSSPTVCVKSHRGKLGILRKAQQELEQQILITQDLQVKLQQVVGEKEALQNEVKAKKLERPAKRRLLRVAKTNKKVKLESSLEVAQKDLEQQISRNKDLRVKEETMETEKAPLQNELELELSRTEELESELRLEKVLTEKLQLRLSRAKKAAKRKLEAERAETNKLQVALKEAEDLLKAERLHSQQERNSLQEVMEKTKASFAAQLLNQQEETNALVAALNLAELKVDTDKAEVEARTKTQEYERALIFERAQSQKLQLKLSKMREAAKSRRESLMPAHQSEAERVETRRVTAALKEAQHLLEAERQLFNKEKTAILEEMEKSTAALGREKETNTKLMTALKEAKDFIQEETEMTATSLAAMLSTHKNEITRLNATLRYTEQQLDDHLKEWQEEKDSLLQDTESVKKILQEKEQEWEKTESSMKTQLEDLQSQIPNKGKKKLS